ncbi:helix-turn-helix domain-containing protein [Parashewanella curva]|uniref:Helix-turn-helix domain-containing protein n=1 Tax=Parashewanella curva TaxID=2338552 RepID=A0A3L8Q290_9GAMM|nr:helix-turn-helix domain-containing protein [Parashewanella curva]RLV60978.1 helix-turn-helix domain-containing protein [Parashewanella curva]
MEDKILIGQRIKQARNRLGLSQEDLGKELGLSSQSIQSWEKGRSSPRGPRLPKLAAALQTTPQYLIFGTGQDSNEGYEDIVEFITSEGFQAQTSVALNKALAAAVRMRWISFGRDVTANTIIDMFQLNILEEYGIDPDVIEQSNKKVNS